jgi:hypothetical protein
LDHLLGRELGTRRKIVSGSVVEGLLFSRAQTNTSPSNCEDHKHNTERKTELYEDTAPVSVIVVASISGPVGEGKKD